MTGDDEDRIARGLASRGLEEALPAVPALAELLRRLRDANARINLVSRATIDGPDLVDRHLLDSLLGLRFVPREARAMLDIGSGGGFPALPLLLVRRDLAGTLVEATGKKARFLEETSRALGLTAEIVNARFPGSFPMNAAPRFDVLTSRAVADAGELVRAARPLLLPDARALLWTTEPLVAEMRRAGRGLHRVEFHRAPGGREPWNSGSGEFHVKHSTGESTAFPPRVLAIANQKGGVGKTTTAISLAAALAVLERKVLLIDFDPQGNATGGLGVDKGALRSTVYPWLLAHASFEETVVDTDLPFLKLLPSSRDLVGAEVELVGAERREFRLAERIEPLRDRFDFILIDCPPSLGLLTVNGLTAADGVLLPIQCEYFALEGVSELLATIERVQEALNPRLVIGGVIATMWDDRTNLSRQVLEDIRRFFGEKTFKSAVPRNVRLSEAPSFGKPIFLYDVKSRGAEAYLSIARELLLRTEKPEPVAAEEP